jgi:hypothetical protein
MRSLSQFLIKAKCNLKKEVKSTNKLHCASIEISVQSLWSISK